MPIGGTENIARTLIRGLEKHGGKLQMNAHVDQVLVENGRAVGVRLKNGKVVKARKAVVSNATPFDTVKMLARRMSGVGAAPRSSCGGRPHARRGPRANGQCGVPVLTPAR